MYQKYWNLLQVGKEMETGQSELANKSLFAPFPNENQEQAMKNKEAESTNPDTTVLAHKKFQQVLY